MKFKKSKEAKPKKVKRITGTTVMVWRNFAAFTLILLLVVTLVCYGILGGSFFGQAKKRLEAVGNYVAEIVGDPANPPSVVESQINDCALVHGVNVFLIDSRGGLIFPQTFINSREWNTVVSDLNANAGEWEEGKSEVYDSTAQDKTTLNYYHCLKFGGENCRLLVRYPLEVTKGVVRQMQIYVLIIAAVAVVVAFLVSYLIAEKLSRPLRNMSRTAKKLAAGDFSVQFTSLEYEEIANLSSALNYMKDELKKSGDFQKELLANVSHDLKTPLTMIKAYASMIQEISGDDKEKRNKHLQVIIDESDRLTGLVNDVLSASKISSGIAQLNKKVFNLTEYLYGVINKFGYLQETQGYNIMVDVDANLYTLADEEKIGQVIYNLISNAVNYTGEDKTVYISLKYSLEDDRIKFSVRDTGKGIGKEELEHIWDRYYRSKDSHMRPVKGTGLGLNIVKAILESHAFAYGVVSDEGKGSTFYVDFPSVKPLPDGE